MKKLKVLTVVGTRPEIIRLSQVILKLDKAESIEHVLIHTGQNYDYELNEVFFEELGLRKPDYYLNAAGDNATITAGQILIDIDPVLENVKPDAFLVLGDTNSCLCVIAAKKRKIPIFHMEAGNRCFDQRVPEETNRRIVDHVSDINLTYSDISREYLLREGISADRIIKTGSPMFEVLHAYMNKINSSTIKETLDLEERKYFVVSSHREENISSQTNFRNLINALNIREAHERPEAIEEGSVMMVGMSEERIIQGLSILNNQNKEKNRTLRSVADYSMPNVSDKVIRIILSYTDYVNRKVWIK